MVDNYICCYALATFCWKAWQKRTKILRLLYIAIFKIFLFFSRINTIPLLKKKYLLFSPKICLRCSRFCRARKGKYDHQNDWGLQIMSNLKLLWQEPLRILSNNMQEIIMFLFVKCYVLGNIHLSSIFYYPSECVYVEKHVKDIHANTS